KTDGGRSRPVTYKRVLTQPGSFATGSRRWQVRPCPLRRRQRKYSRYYPRRGGPLRVHGAAPDAVHSRTSYSKATPSGSFSSNHFSAASTLANTLMWSASPTCLLVLT